uniref:Uncharacterized protein n=1 Tax=Fagus sylvatica TaxID=28930 RepID=A0A2N9H956_FAGSY
MVEAERRLLANALLDVSNQRFVLLSESCIPLFNFSTIYNYLMGSTETFVEVYDLPGPVGQGRFNRKMSPTIKLKQWRKGSQWFEMDRDLAIETKLVKEIGSMVKALSARVFIRVFEVCWSFVLIPPNGGSRDHRPVCIYSPHIASRKALATVGVSLPSEETVNMAFLQAPSEITLYLPDFPVGWAYYLRTYGRSLPIGFGLYSRLISLAVTQCLLGSLWAVVLWASLDHVTCLPLGLLQMALVDCLCQIPTSKLPRRNALHAAMPPPAPTLHAATSATPPLRSTTY